MRAATAAEEAAVRAAFEAVDAGLFARVRGPRRVAVWEQDGWRVAGLVPDAVLALPPDVLEPAGGGVAVGGFQGGAEPAFTLGLQGAAEAARHTQRGTVRVTEKASQLFLYGRNVLGDSVLSADARLRNGDRCIVCNPRGEALGVGAVVGRFKGGGEAVRPLHDLGAYLREETVG